MKITFILIIQSISKNKVNLKVISDLIKYLITQLITILIQLNG